MAKKKASAKEKKIKVKPVKCKKCGHSFMPHEAQPKKQWTLVSPMPDKDGNVTITMMASWDCPNCGKNITGSMGKTKGDQTGPSKKELIDEKLAAKSNFNINEFAKSLKVSEENLSKILKVHIKKGNVKAKIVDSEFIFE